MSNIKPFRGYRPVKDKAHLVAALPYDVMDSNEARIMAKDNPYSFLHVDKAEIDLPEGISLYDDAVYQKAAENLNRMISDGIYIRDEKDVFYIYSLTMAGREQTGLVCCADVEEYIEGKIKKHELTRREKEQDRIRHVDTCNANTGPIFLAYRERAEITSLINEYKDSIAPVYNFTNEDNVTHKVWVVDKNDVIDRLKLLFSFVPSLYIADGHHRNASAVNVALKRRSEAKVYDPSAEYNYYLAVLFPDSDLHIMSYNRVVKDLNNLSKEEFMEKLGEKFIIEDAPESPFSPYMPHRFGMYLDKKWYRLISKEEIIDTSTPVSVLDVSILQKNVLEDILGIADIRTDSRIDFVGGIRGLNYLEELVDSNQMRVAFSMFPTSIAQMMDIADASLIMPPKSTWFEPKLRSGIFIHSLSE